MQTTTGKRVFISGLIFTFLSLGSVVRGQTYYVQPGDSLYSIAARYGTSITALQQDNGLTTTTVYPGQALRLSRQVSAATVSSTYTVRPGDSLLIIAKRYQVSLDALKEANNLSVNYVTAGQRLTIPVSSNESSGTNSITYIVKTGDPLYLIAKRYGISLKALLTANNLTNASSIFPGQKLLIPQTSSDSGSSSNKFNLSQSDNDLLARLVSAEASGEPLLGQVAVAATILNRLEDPRYPKTISGIIYQVDNGSYQYSPVLDGRINLSASASAYQAVEQAISGSDPSNGANGFYNPEKTTNEWVRSQTVTATIGDHVFYKY